MSNAPLLEVKNLGKRFGGFVALEGVDLAINKGARVGLIGPNGAGKSTFVNCLSGSIPFETGSITFAGRDISKLPAHKRTHLGLARSFQLPRPFGSMTVRENLDTALAFGRTGRREILSAAARRDAVDQTLGLVEMQQIADKMPADLSQVDLRRLELARALVTDPELLIADETMAGLSNAECDAIVDLLLKLNEHGTTILLIEHIMRAILRYSESLAVFVNGRKLAFGEPNEVLARADVVEAYLGQSLEIENVG